MVKVIKERKENEAVCHYCGSVLEYEVTDIEEKEVFFSALKSDIVKYIICPKCRGMIYIRRK